MEEYLANPASFPGRETFLAPVTWDADGWPVFNGNVSIGETGPGLYNLSDPLAATSFHDAFDSTELNLSYYFLRTPRVAFHSVVDGKLRIQGSPFSVGNRESPALLMRKQTAFNQHFETVLDFVPETAKQEAGLTIFYSDIQHSEIGITLCPSAGSLPANATLLGNPTNTTRCVVNRLIYSNNGTGIALANATVAVTSYHPIDADGPVKLAIQSENTRYSFGFTQGDLNSTVTYVGTIDSLQLYLAPPGCVPAFTSSRAASDLRADDPVRPRSVATFSSRASTGVCTAKAAGATCLATRPTSIVRPIARNSLIGRVD